MVRDFALALRARKVSGAFEKRATGPVATILLLKTYQKWFYVTTCQVVLG